MDRVFVPLTKESFADFLMGKQYEVRRRERQWSEKNVRSGRAVTLSCGYSGARMNGVVGDVVVGSMEAIFQCLPYLLVEPRATGVQEATRMNIDTLGAAPAYIAFQVILE